MSEISFHYISLEELVDLSALILVVSKAKPEMTEEKILIDSEGKLPPYLRYKYHFIVREVLHNRTDLEVKDKVISVLNAEDDIQYELHREYYLKGLSKSPVYRAYKKAGTQEPLGESFLIFLNLPEKNQLKFSVQFAFESLEAKQSILKLTKKKGYNYRFGF